MSKTNKKVDIKLRLYKWELILGLICVAIVGFMAVYAIVSRTPLRYTIPGYPDATERYQNTRNAIRIDSLERSIARWEFYSKNLRNVLEGAAPVQIDSIIKRSNIEYESRKTIASRQADSLLRKVEESEEMSKPDYGNQKEKSIEDFHFFKPLDGTMTRRYEMVGHPCLNISAPEGSTVKSAMDGHVVYTGWMTDDEWSIVIQHEKGILSVYRHCSKLFKKETDKVEAGTAIGILGADGSDGFRSATLRFELWQNGIPVDPTLYIKF